MAHIEISENELKKLIKTSIEESGSYDFPEFIILETIKVLKSWSTTLDYYKIKKLQKAVNLLLKEFEEQE